MAKLTIVVETDGPVDGSPEDFAKEIIMRHNEVADKFGDGEDTVTLVKAMWGIRPTI